MSQPSLGIMAFYLNKKKKMEERPYFKKLIAAGEKNGLDTFLFTPEDIRYVNKQIYSHRYDFKKNRWVRKWDEFPDMIFDRCRYQPTKRFLLLNNFRKKYPDLVYLNRPLANKWIIHQVLSNNIFIRQHLPSTQLATSRKDFIQFLDRPSTFYYKPINGTGGRGILRVEPLGNHLFIIEGRDQLRKIIRPQKVTKSQLLIKLSTWKNAKQNYILQKGIHLKLKNGRVHDYRLLIQKNGQGKWDITGCAGRIGANRSVTSNLHGGGKAVPMDHLLKKWFPETDKVESIKSKVYELAFAVIHELEKKYPQMCELALDIGIDRSGHPWILEINPKPSREIFARIGEKETYKKAVVRPIEYAHWLYHNNLKK